MVELLAPAGDFEALEAALMYGADAVYLGGPQLQLRAKRTAFDETGLQKAVAMAHEKGKKVYVTVNAFAYDDEIDRMADYARYLFDIGADAAIVGDIGILCAIKDAAPELAVHVSTQANCMNARAARAYWDMGAARVVLSREVSLEQIAELHSRIPAQLELEAFVHGAMCMAYSGRCIISSYLAGRSGNRGLCAQPCRWNYVLLEEKRPGEYIPIEENDAGTQILSSHDLCMIDYVKQLEAAGVCSFKIEGRMKSAYYTATVTNAYRRAIDETAGLDFCRGELSSIRHRPYSTGFYFRELAQNHAHDPADQFECVFAAKVLSCEYGTATIQQRGNFAVGDVLETIAREGDTKKIPVTALINEEGQSQPNAPHPMQVLKMPCDCVLTAGEFLRKRVEK